MKNTLKKIDRWILNTLTQYVRKWIKKNNFEKHKVDFGIKLEEYTLYSLILFAVVLSGVLYVIQGQMFTAFFHASVWLVLAAFQYVRIIKMRFKDKPWHDQLFSLRKNPQIYQMEKEVLEHVFQLHIKRRLSFVGFHAFITFWIVGALGALTWIGGLGPAINMTLIYLVIGWATTSISMYLICVFDFDEPEEKKKVVKESLTEMVSREWQRIVEGLAPQPKYG